MRVERIAKDKVRIFISYDDLEERGIDRDEIWHNGKKVQDLFWDMMETAYMEVGFEIAGPISVEAFTMPTEGVVVIVTRIPSIPGVAQEDDDDDDDEGLIQRHTNYAQSIDSQLVYEFDEFDDLIAVCHTLVDYDLESSLFRYRDAYHLLITDPLVVETHQTIASVLSEYGEPSSATDAVLNEYGKKVLHEDAIRVLVERFPV
ncbi:adaptor protein MecA [Alicyclobacillus fastidiosus]|uniref:Adaptor protein MecA n=1 Tax=Alicyclobacillus fastidiosus TaxID=392011 RepID=A0ABY6ZA56_9BACL|nr:adaptor protein MecA [Alicyclobacillus fastidiosus]WAH39610.1 adaptor protein MecA [Alicyclobacillus fastidiosus]